MTTLTDEAATLGVLRAACHQVGLDPSGAEPIRLSENALYRLSGGVVVRIAREGQLDATRKELAVARWLESVNITAVQAIPNLIQPVEVDRRAVSFWRELPPHENSTPAQVAVALRRLHGLPRPMTLELPPIQPFVRLPERIDGASTFTDADRSWMREHLAELEQRWDDRPAGLSECVVHGDAWVGNIVSTSDGRVALLDLERFAIGPPEWDLVHIADEHFSFGWLSAEHYAGFCQVYGHDVSRWQGYTTLRDIREFRQTLFAAQVAAANPAVHDQATHRLACIRDQLGPRPWSGWRAVT